MKTKLILSFAALSSLPSAAALRTWDGGDATSNMTAAANWNGNTVINPAVDDLNFPSGLALAERSVNNNYAANTLFKRLEFYDGGYTLNGTIMGLSDGISCFTDAGTTVTVNAGISLQNTGFLTSSKGNLAFGAGNQIFLGGHTLNLAASFPVGSITVGGLLAGSGQINVTGLGSVRFSGAKTFTASVDISDFGTLIIDNAGGLGTGAGTTTIGSGTLELDSAAALSIPERIQMKNTDPAQSLILSKGGAHTLSGPIEFSGDWFKRFEVQGPSLTVSGVISGPDSFGSMTKMGPGRLILSGAASNTAGIQILGINAGEVFLNKSGGATAVSSPYIILGTNAVLPHNSILRLGASHQIADATRVDVGSDGWFDLNGRNETINDLQFRGSGHVTGNGGTLRIEEGVYASSAAQNGGVAVIDGAVTLAAANSEWEVAGGAEDIDLTVNGTVTSLAPGGVLTKNGLGSLIVNGNLSLPTLNQNGGAIGLAGQSPDTDVNVSGGVNSALFAIGSLRDVSLVEHGTLFAARFGPQTNEHHLACRNLSITDSVLGVGWQYAAPVPGVTHTAFEVSGDVILSGAGLSLGTDLGDPEDLPPGSEIVFINKTSPGPVTGQFTGRPEGSVENLLPGQYYYLSYQGGDGNDVSFTRIVPPTGTTRLWDGGSAVDDNWMTAANWNPNGVPQPGDDLVFPAVAARKVNTNNFAYGTTFNSITVHGTGYDIDGPPVTLNQKLEFTSANATHSWTMGLELVLPIRISVTGNTVVDCHTGTTIYTNGKQLTLHNAGGGDGDFRPSKIVGTGTVRKTGAGKVTFSNAVHEYTGDTTVEEGTLVLRSLGVHGSSDFIVSAGATLELATDANNVFVDEDITLYGRLRDRGGLFSAQLDGALHAAANTATLEVSGTVTQNGIISGSVLHKTGTGALNVGGFAGNTLNGGMFADAGLVRLQKTIGHAFPCPVIIGNADLPATVAFEASNQLSDTGTVQIVHSTGVLDLGTHSDTIGGLVMNGGNVTGTAAGRLTLGVLNVQANAATAVIAVPIANKAGSNGVLQIADGAASTDLRLDSAVYGTGFDKTGAGRVDFMAEIPLAGLDLLNLQQGSALFFNNSRYTDIHLNGGLLGGNGTVGNISSITGGTVSPGASPGAFGGNIATWNAATTLRMELNGLAPGAEYDQYFVNSELNLGSTALALSLGFDPLPGAEFMIVRNVGGSAINGTFTGIPQNGYVSTAGAKVFQINYAGGDGDDVVLTRVEVDAPEIVEHSMAPGTGEEKGYNDTDLTVLGTPGLTYQLESSTDLVAWTVQQSVKADLQTGLMQFEFLNPESDPRLFLRVRLP